MKIKYKPWDDSHAPKKFERTDKTGRLIPIYGPDAKQKFEATLIAFICFGWAATMAALLIASFIL